MEMAMNGRSTLCYSDIVDPGEASSTGFENFLEMFGARHSSGDLFDLVRQGGGRASGGDCSMEVQPARLLSSSPPPAVTLPPSEDDMAAWLYSIVSGQEPAVVAGQPSAVVGHTVVDNAPADHKMERPSNMEEKCHSGAEDSAKIYSCGSRKKATRGARRSHPAETRKLTEKIRRCKINEKLKTLQRLVPGCDDKSNQASTLDQTIRHIKLLQQHIEVQSLAHKAVYPVVPPPPPYLPPGAAILAPAVLAMTARGHVRPEVVLAPPRSGDGPFISSTSAQ